MTTTSTLALLQQLRAAILTTVTPDAHTAAEQLGDVAAGRLYLNRAPENAAYPYGTLRLVNLRQELDGARLSGSLELMLYHRPRKQAAALEQLADWCQLALSQYADGSSGLLRAEMDQRDTLPEVPEPADRELVQIRLTARVIAYPAWLAAAAS